MPNKLCWHKWDEFKSLKQIRYYHYIETTTKICRKCGQKRIKEKIVNI